MQEFITFGTDSRVRNPGFRGYKVLCEEWVSCICITLYHCIVFVEGTFLVLNYMGR